MAHTHRCTRTVSSHVLPALLVIPQTNYNVFSSSSSSSFLLLHLPQSTLSFQLQLDLDKDGFPFSSLFFAALAKEGFARGDYTQTLTQTHTTCTLTDCSVETLHLRKNIFTNKQAPHSPPPPFPDPPHLTTPLPAL